MAIVLMVAAAPMGVLGLIIYLGADQSATTHSGVAGGLSGLGGVVGVLLIVVAACMFLFGAVVYARSGKE